MGLFLFCISLSLYASKSPVTVTMGKDQVVINLVANPTTGYQWSVIDYDKTILQLKSGVYQKNSSQLIGSGGQMVFTFGLKKATSYPSQTKILFQYARPWEKTGGTQQKVVVNLK